MDAVTIVAAVASGALTSALLVLYGIAAVHRRTFR